MLILPGLLPDRQASTQALLAASSLRLSRLAVMLLSGIYNAWSLFGRLLVAKIILVGDMIALGAVNRYRYVPSPLVQAGQPQPRSVLPIPHFLNRQRIAQAPNTFSAASKRKPYCCWRHCA